MNIQATLDIRGFTELADRLSVYQHSTMLETISRVVIKHIQTNSKAGLDANGNTFHPYNKAYAARRMALGLATEPKNLTVTGGLLNAMRYKQVSETEGEIRFKGSNKNGTNYSTIADGLMNSVRRTYWERFFLISKAAKDEFVETVSKEITEVGRGIH